MPFNTSNQLTGTWTYRSFRNNPEPVGDDPEKLRRLLFGEGELIIDEADAGQIKGRLSFGPDFPMELRGTFGEDSSVDGPSLHCRIQGTGVAGTQTEGWVYDYVGYLVPIWPNGIDQRTALVGSVIRSVAHSGGSAPAGYVACFIAVRH